MLNVAPGKDHEYRHLCGWLAASDRLDRLIEATEPHRVQAPAPAPVAAVAESPSRPRRPHLAREGVGCEDLDIVVPTDPTSTSPLPTPLRRS
jgi:hypothetical protein